MSKKIFRDFLTKEGFRLTRQREAIFNEIELLGGHFDLEELFFSLRKKGIMVSKASIYRVVPLLKECGLINQVIFKDKHSHYEFTYKTKHHDHMICLECGKVIEFVSPSIERMQDRICKRNGFLSTDHMLEIKGYCKKCK